MCNYPMPQDLSAFIIAMSMVHLLRWFLGSVNQVLTNRISMILNVSYRFVAKKAELVFCCKYHKLRLLRLCGDFTHACNMVMEDSFDEMVSKCHFASR